MKNRLRNLVAAGVVLGLLSSTVGGPAIASATATTTATATATATGTASIAGHVTAKDTGLGLADVSITVCDSSGMVCSSATTDESGNYQVTDVAAGSYSLWFSAGGNYRSTYYGGADYEDRILVALKAGSAITGINVILAQGATISGHVTARTGGASLAGIDVMAHYGSRGQGSGSQTDEQGYFSVPFLPSGPITLNFSGRGFVSYQYPTTLTAVEGEEIIADASLVAGSLVSGQITASATGDPLEAQQVLLISATSPNNDGVQQWSGSSDSEGNYTVTDVPAGTYRILVGVTYLRPEEPSPLYKRTWWGSTGQSFETATTIIVGEESSSDGNDVALARTAAVPGAAAPVATVTLRTTSSGKLTWTKPASTEPIIGYSIDVGNGWSGDGMTVIGANTLTVTNSLFANDGNSKFVSIRAITASSFGWSGSALLAGATGIAAPTLTVTGRTDTTITFKAAPRAGTAPALADWRFITLGDSRILARLSAQPAAGATYTVAGLIPGKKYTIYGFGSPARSYLSTQLGTVSATTYTTAALKALTPTGTAVISGAATVGQTMSVSTGRWATGTRLVTDWFLGDPSSPGVLLSPISQGAALKLTEDHAGSTVFARVTGVKVGYRSVSKTSVVTGLIGGGTFAEAPTPTVSGGSEPAPIVGESLFAEPNDFGWSPWATLNYKWLRDGTPIVDATDTSYELAVDDIGHRISFSVIGTKLGYTTTTRTSAETPAVIGLDLAATGIPTIAGECIFGSTLTADPGEWDAGVAFAYQWFRDGSNISTATAPTYVPTLSDIGAALTVRVTGTKTNYIAVSAVSAETITISTASLVNTPVPTITGTLTVGSTLTAHTGFWDSGVTFGYRWYRNGVSIRGAVNATYSVTASDASKKIILEVTGTKAGFETVSSLSVATTSVAP